MRTTGTSALRDVGSRLRSMLEGRAPEQLALRARFCITRTHPVSSVDGPAGVQASLLVLVV